MKLGRVRLELDGGLQLTNRLAQFSLLPQLEPEVVVRFGGERRTLPKHLAQQRDCARAVSALPAGRAQGVPRVDQTRLPEERRLVLSDRV